MILADRTCSYLTVINWTLANLNYMLLMQKTSLISRGFAKYIVYLAWIQIYLAMVSLIRFRFKNAAPFLLSSLEETRNKMHARSGLERNIFFTKVESRIYHASLARVWCLSSLQTHLAVICLLWSRREYQKWRTLKEKWVLPIFSHRYVFLDICSFSIRFNPPFVCLCS